MNNNPRVLLFSLLICILKCTCLPLSAADFEFVIAEDAKVPRIKYIGKQALAKGASLSIDTDSCELRNLLIQASVDIEGMRTFSKLGKTSWSLSARPLSGLLKSLDFIVQWGYDPSDGAFNSDFLQLSAVATGHDGSTRTLLSKRLHEGVSTVKGKNTLTATWAFGKFQLWIGADKPVYVGLVDEKIPSPAEFILQGNRNMKVGFISCTYFVEPRIPRPDPGAVDLALKTAMATGADNIEGCWEFFDRDTESRYARKGGNYKLAVIKALSDITLQGNAPVYDLVYLDGADVNRSKWKPGMLKGHLFPTPYVNRFKLIWYDAYMTRHDEECFAEYDEALRMFKINFPLLSSRMRFTKAPNTPSSSDDITP